MLATGVCKNGLFYKGSQNQRLVGCGESQQRESLGEPRKVDRVLAPTDQDKCLSPKNPVPSPWLRFT